MNDDAPIPLHQIAARTRYPLIAFEFVRMGLDYTVHRLHEHPELLEEHERHVTGVQLCRGLVDYALEQYGLMARDMLARWNVCRTEDFGQIVFAMVDGGMMQANDGDSVHDFDHVLDFDQAFRFEVPVAHVPLEADPIEPVGHG